MNRSDAPSGYIRTRQHGKARPSGNLQATPSPASSGRNVSSNAAASTNQSSTISRGSTTFQVTMFIVSCLMGAVILAFCLFCAIIYTMRPNATSSVLALIQSANRANQDETSPGLTGAGSPFGFDRHSTNETSDALGGHLVLLGAHGTNLRGHHHQIGLSNAFPPYAVNPPANLVGVTLCKKTDLVMPTATAAVCCDSITGHNPFHLITPCQIPASQFGQASYGHMNSAAHHSLGACDSTDSSSWNQTAALDRVPIGYNSVDNYNAMSAQSGMDCNAI